MIYQYTGNPFVDAGIWGLCEWREKKNPEELDIEDIEKTLEDIIPLYLTKEWKKSLYSVFPNNAVTNPSVKNKELKLKEVFDTLLSQLEPLKESGTCIACGRRDVQSIRTKSEIPLLGSGTLINYFPFGQPGGDYCPACTLAVQFSPLVMRACGKLLLLHSNSEKIMRYWAQEAVADVSRQMTFGNYAGCFDEGYKNPVTAFFHTLENIIIKYEERWSEENPSISIYHFTNYNQGPDLEIYVVPTPVFRFLANILGEKAQEWAKIVRRGYPNWQKIKEEKEYKSKPNAVYNRLLKGASIIRYFINYKRKGVYGDWELLCDYLTEVRKMSEKRLETLKKVGDYISAYIQSSQDIKRLNQLEQANRYSTFRNQLRLIEKSRINKGIETPLFTLEEYMEDLFPQGYLSWRETQDLLLFRIYENLHSWLIEQPELKTEIQPEESEEERESAEKENDFEA